MGRSDGNYSVWTSSLYLPSEMCLSVNISTFRMNFDWESSSFAVAIMIATHPLVCPDFEATGSRLSQDS